MSEDTKKHEDQGAPSHKDPSGPVQRSGGQSTNFAMVFLAVVLGGAMILAAVIINAKRPAAEVAQPTAAAVKATGKCAHCHRQVTPAIVAQFETSAHAKNDVTCLDCHAPQQGQTPLAHNGFSITTEPTSSNCATCHKEQQEQYLRSRHAAPAWAAVAGRDDFTPEQLAHAEKFHPGATDRAANGLAIKEGAGVKPAGCNACHSIGKPNSDGSIGNCTQCHSRHAASVSLARQPETCGQCHMGPDHSQLEIFSESKHGVMYAAQKEHFNLDAKPSELSIEDISVPNCAVCHMSGLEGSGVTHDVTERLSWYLFAPTSKKRDGYTSGQAKMKGICTNCHASNLIDGFYERAEEVVEATNDKVQRMDDLMKGLREAELLTKTPFDEPIEFLEFDYWHYYGRTAKHGAFMGGADFVQWHGNYELLKVYVEMEELAIQLYEKAKLPLPPELATHAAHEAASAEHKPTQDKPTEPEPARPAPSSAPQSPQPPSPAPQAP